MHCCSHSLNLALVSASNLTSVRNMYACVRNVLDFINSSPKTRPMFQATVAFKCGEAK